MGSSTSSNSYELLSDKSTPIPPLPYPSDVHIVNFETTVHSMRTDPKTNTVCIEIDPKYKNTVFYLNRYDENFINLHSKINDYKTYNFSINTKRQKDITYYRNCFEIVDVKPRIERTITDTVIGVLNVKKEMNLRKWGIVDRCIEVVIKNHSDIRLLFISDTNDFASNSASIKINEIYTITYVKCMQENCYKIISIIPKENV